MPPLGIAAAYRNPLESCDVPGHRTPVPAGPRGGRCLDFLRFV